MVADEKCGLGFGDGFKFGLGFFTAGVIFYIIVVVVSLILFASVIHPAFWGF